MTDAAYNKDAAADAHEFAAEAAGRLSMALRLVSPFDAGAARLLEVARSSVAAVLAHVANRLEWPA